MKTNARAPLLVLALAAGSSPALWAQTPIRAAIRNVTADSIGSLELTESGGGIRFRIVAGALPPGMLGMHIHRVGRCDSPTFASSGPHLNPLLKQHGHQNPMGPHLGDLGNLTVDARGRADAVFFVTGGKLLPGPRSLRGDDGASAFVIHERTDDEYTDPAGNAGSRIACAVIEEPKK